MSIATGFTAIETAIRSYYQRVLEDSRAKDEPFPEAAELSASPSEIVEIGRQLSHRPTDIFFLYSVAKGLLPHVVRLEALSTVDELLPRWLHACVNAGAYADCLSLSDLCLQSSQWGILGRRPLGLRLLLTRAKALRNLGDFHDSLGEYRTALEQANRYEHHADVAIILILIGKLYGNYLGQRSLFSSFVEEAFARLERLLSTVEIASHDAATTVRRYIAMCHDSLGQAHKETEPDRALKHFEKALAINNEIGRTNGTARALCHLHYLQFAHANAEQRGLHLSEFRRGLEMVIQDPMEHRGLGIRSLQYATMLRHLGELARAGETLEKARQFADRYSDHKTLTRVLIAQAELESSSDRAIQLLQEARDVARHCKLRDPETNINRRLAEALAVHGGRGPQPYELFDRNRQLLMDLISDVKGTLARFADLPGTTSALEVQALSLLTRQTFRERILLDFDRATTELNLNVKSLVAALRHNEQDRQNFLLFGIMNAMARVLLHDAKLLLYSDGGRDPFSEIARGLDALADELVILGVEPLPRLDAICARLHDYSQRITSFAYQMSKLRTTLTQQIRRPDFEQEVRLEVACRRAIDELHALLTVPGGAIELHCEADVRVFLEEGFLAALVQNLIRNALEALKSPGSEPGRVELRIATEQIGDVSIGNTARAATLTVSTFTRAVGHAARLADEIRRGLHSRLTTKPHSTGVGFELARIVFESFMGAKVVVVEDSHQAGLKIAFPIGSGVATIAADD